MNRKFPTPSMERYFSSLPPYIQETLMQSGVTFPDEDALRATAVQLLQRGVMF